MQLGAETLDSLVSLCSVLGYTGACVFNARLPSVGGESNRKSPQCLEVDREGLSTMLVPLATPVRTMCLLLADSQN